MTKTLTLRPETPADRADVATVLARGYLGNGAAAIALLSELRDLPSFNRDLALVGLMQNKISAFASLIPVKVGSKTDAALLLAPIAIDSQNPNLTPADWVNTVLAEVSRQGHRYVMVQGAPDVYLPHGFIPANTLGINGGHDEEDNLLLLKDLQPTAPMTLKGEVEYPHA